MSIQLTGPGKRFRVSGALIALALGAAVFFLATQARSIWATGNEPQVQPGQAITVPAADMGSVNTGYTPHPCRPKYGCQNGGGTAEEPNSNSGKGEER